MGIANSREWFKQRLRKQSPSPRSGRGGRNQKRRYFRRRQPTLTTLPIIPTITQPLSYQPLYAGGLIPAYGRVQPMPSPYLPISYNNYPVPSQVPPQYMMMMAPSQQVAPSPYISPPYVQQAQIQPAAYNNIGYPGSIPGGNVYYPLSYPSAPTRLITDWTGGGKISPGFLGPPI
jgi:hypothetical protein